MQHEKLMYTTKYDRQMWQTSRVVPRYPFFFHREAENSFTQCWICLVDWRRCSYSWSTSTVLPKFSSRDIQFASRVASHIRMWTTCAVDRLPGKRSLSAEFIVSDPLFDLQTSRGGLKALKGSRPQGSQLPPTRDQWKCGFETCI